jgi:ubiquitin-like modifier-activating enzyme ATG7
MAETDKIVKFQPFTSNVNVTFWYELSRRKLEIFKLSEEPVTIYGYYGIDNQEDLPAFFYLALDSFDSDFK